MYEHFLDNISLYGYLILCLSIQLIKSSLLSLSSIILSFYVVAEMC